MGVGSGAAAAAAVVVAVGGLLVAADDRSAQPPPAPTPATVAAPADRVEYGWPTGHPGEMVHPFLAPPERWAAGHRGVDLAVADGGPVRAAADGVVVFAGLVAGRGVVSVDHDDGVRTTYEPVTAAVTRGEVVSGGQVVGHVDGPGHCAPAACLHWGARRGKDGYLDPLTLLGRDVVVRLLPRGTGAGP